MQRKPKDSVFETCLSKLAIKTAPHCLATEIQEICSTYCLCRFGKKVASLSCILSKLIGLLSSFLTLLIPMKLHFSWNLKSPDYYVGFWTGPMRSNGLCCLDTSSLTSFVFLQSWQPVKLSRIILLCPSVSQLSEHSTCP